MTLDTFLEQFEDEFNRVLNNMYHLEIVPDIQSKINERIPKGGFTVFRSQELQDWLRTHISEMVTLPIEPKKYERNPIHNVHQPKVSERSAERGYRST